MTIEKDGGITLYLFPEEMDRAVKDLLDTYAGPGVPSRDGLHKAFALYLQRRIEKAARSANFVIQDDPKEWLQCLDNSRALATPIPMEALTSDIESFELAGFDPRP